MPPIHVGKPYDQRSLTSHMSGRRALEMTRPAPVGAMVIVKTLGTYALVKSTVFFILFLRVLAHGPYSGIPVKLEYNECITRELESQIRS